MKRASRFDLFWTIIVCLGIIVQQDAVAEDEISQIEASLTATVPAQMAASGPMPVLFTLTNVGENDFAYYKTYGSFLTSIHVFDDDGNLCPPAFHGKINLAHWNVPEDPMKDIHRGKRVVLNPGELQSATRDVSESYNLAPGSYHLIARAQVLLDRNGTPEYLTLDTAEHTFEVTAPVVTGDMNGRLELNIAKSHEEGEPIAAYATFTNLGEHRMAVLRDNMSHQIELTLYDEQGNRCEPTEYGQQTLTVWPNNEWGYRGTGIVEFIPSAKSYTWEKDLQRCFNLKPGKYTLTAKVFVDSMVKYDFPRSLPFESEPVTFEVVSPKEKPSARLDISVADKAIVDQELFATFILTNTGDEDFVICVEKGIYQVRMEMNRPDEKRVPRYREGGHTSRYPRNQAEQQGKTGEFVKLKPGESYSWKDDLNRHFEIEPGLHQINAFVIIYMTKDDNINNSFIRSRSYEIEVISPDAERNLDAMVKISIPSSIKQYEAFFARPTLINFGKVELVRHIMLGYGSFAVDIIDVEGKHLPRKDRAEFEIDYSPPHGFRAGSGYFKQFKPGERYMEKVNLNRCFEFTPGKYTMLASITATMGSRKDERGFIVPNEVTIRSTPYEFEVTEPDEMSDIKAELKGDIPDNVYFDADFRQAFILTNVDEQNFVVHNKKYSDLIEFEVTDEEGNTVTIKNTANDNPALETKSQSSVDEYVGSFILKIPGTLTNCRPDLKKVFEARTG